jgi:hypothetical protein
MDVLEQAAEKKVQKRRELPLVVHRNQRVYKRGTKYKFLNSKYSHFHSETFYP